MKNLTVLLAVLFLSPVNSFADEVVLKFEGTTQKRGEAFYCDVEVTEYNNGAAGEIVYKPGEGLRTSFFQNYHRDHNLFYAEFKNYSPGSGDIFSGYTPASKSEGRILVYPNSDGLFHARIEANNCIERKVLGVGTGTFKCVPFSEICLSSQ